MKPVLTYDIAYAAGKDAANRRMRKGNRTKWDVDDYNEAAKECNRLLDIIERYSVDLPV